MRKKSKEFKKLIQIIIPGDWKAQNLNLSLRDIKGIVCGIIHSHVFTLDTQ